MSTMPISRDGAHGTADPRPARARHRRGPPPDGLTGTEDSRPFVRDVLPDVVRSAPTAVAVYRADRSVAFRNDAWVSLFGDGPAVAGRSDPIALALASGLPTENQEHDARRRDGSVIRVLLDVVPLVDGRGGLIGATAYARPVDRAAMGTLREAFLGVLSHELRTPITTIYGGSQLLLNDQLSAESRGEVLAAIAAEAEQLHRRVEDFLALARVERGTTRPEREPLLLQHLIAHAVATEARRTPDRRIHVRSPHDLPPAVGDAAQVGQVLRNLITNAIDGSPPTHAVDIRAARDQLGVRVVVQDRGPGFVGGTSEDAFLLSHRHPAAGGHAPRSALGMYVARALVEANDGRIWLKERRGGGTEVGFSLPLFEVEREH
jgi:K+-sensing histidine kinase KdpD